MNKLDELSLFFPFWNEEKNIERVINNAVPVMVSISKKWEILLIDDGSSDKTLEIAKKIAKKNSNIRVISHSPNRGYGAALKSGFENSKYKTIVFTDGDGQFDFKEVSKFIDQIKTSEIVIGYRKKRQDKFIRHILMNMLKIWDYVFFGFWFKDIDCGFKMFKSDALSQILPLRSEGAMITTEILAKAVRKKINISEVQVIHYPRKYGNQSGANFSVIIRAVLESLIIWWDIKNKRI